MSVGPRVLVVQYANPAAYPPVEHAIELLVEAGCEAAVVGIRRAGEPLELPRLSGLFVDLLDAPAAGWRQKAHYARFAARVLHWTRRWRPDWLYVSDPLAAPAALLAARATSARVVYHEHDAPDSAAEGAASRAVLRARARLARRAALCLAPSTGRADRLRAETGAQAVDVVWNCPRRREVAAARTAPVTPDLRLLYHGSLVPARLPMTLLEAMAYVNGTTLGLAGYETAGHPGYVRAFLARARELGLADRVRWTGTLSSRADVLRHADGYDVGLALLPADTADFNEQTMAGASNKPFDYLARGLALLVSDRPEWRALYANAGLARACRAESAPALAAELRWFAAHPDERQAMGERGRQRILGDWNYDHLFARVRDLITSSRARAAVPVHVAAHLPVSQHARRH